MSGVVESNLPAIAEKIFGVPSKEKGTIELGLADCAPPDATETDKTKILFEVLMQLMLEGIRVRFGDALTPASLTAAQCEDISRYVLSYGFVLHIRSEHITVAPPVSEIPASTDLKDYCERFYDFEREMWHEAYFEQI